LGPTKKTRGYFLKKHLIQTNKIHHKSYSFVFIGKMYYEVKSKISSTLVL